MRSSRQIQRRCIEDLAFRVLAGNQAPDRVTIARFRVRHQQAPAGFLVQSLRLCAAAGLVRVGTVALDGTKVAANAADKANRTLDKLQAEDRQHGSLCGDELPAALANPSGRLARLQQAKAQLEAEAAERQRRPGRLLLQHLGDRIIGRRPLGQLLDRDRAGQSARGLPVPVDGPVAATVNTQAPKARSSPRNRSSPPITDPQVSAARSSAASCATTWK